jgi:hypothetical protein
MTSGADPVKRGSKLVETLSLDHVHATGMQ